MYTIFELEFETFTVFAGGELPFHAMASVTLRAPTALDIGEHDVRDIYSGCWFGIAACSTQQ